MNKNNISEKLRELRSKYGFTQEDMADKLCISQSGYAKIEAGITKIGLDKAIQLKEIFKDDLDITDILPDVSQVIQNNFKFDSGAMSIVFDNLQSQQEETIQHLKKEIEHLRQQNKNLLDLLGKDKK